MRKALFIILAFMITSFNVKAVPSYPYPISYTQPDGSVVTLQLRGDEFDHKVLIDGVSCTLAPDGFWRPVSVPPSTKSVFQTPTRKTRQNSEPKLSPSICKGEKRFLVLLVEFQDLKFTTNKNYFVKTLNEKGYSEGGATGSAYDYFCDNSSEQFKPTFDIVGPISLSEKYSYYGENDENGNDKNAHMALYNACQIAQKNSLVDFSKYDNDGDGYVDNVFFYFAGYSEAEGANPSTIWPHAWYLESGAGKTLSINGKKIDRYACTAELNGNKGSTPSGIGVFCHEFSHVLGLPDLYDTDYEKSGNARTVNIWSIMSNGAYLNESMTPPYFMGVERERLGWVKITPLTKEGEITIAPIQTNICYSTTTSKKDEIFLYEYRNGAKWDTYIPKGLAVMHKDASTRDVNGFTAATRWATGSGINSYGDHPCGYLVWANPTATNIYQYPFPGSNNIRFFEGVDWNGKATSFQFSNIRITEEGIKATLSLDKEKKLFGVVTDNEGVPIEGAEISLNLLETATKAYLSTFSAKRLTTAKSGSLYYTTTDEQGSYSILLEGEVETEFEMTVSCRGYIGKNENVSIASGSVNRDFSLTPFTHSKEGSIVLYNYQPSSVVGGLYVLRWNKKTDDYLVGTTFKSSALAKYVGARLDSIFILCPAVGITSGEVVVDYDGSRLKNAFTQSFSKDEYTDDGLTRFNVSAQDFRIPADRDITVGYRIIGNSDANNSFAYFTTDVNDGGLLYTTPGYEWYERENSTAIIFISLSYPESTLSSAGINIIDVPDNLTAGSSMTLKLIQSTSYPPKSVEWIYDGEKHAGNSVYLTSGEHELKAIITLSNGVTETLERWIKVD